MGPCSAVRNIVDSSIDDFPVYLIGSRKGAAHFAF